MSGLWQRILEDKQRHRRHLRELPFREKVAILEKLRDRSALISQNPLRERPFAIMQVGVNGRVVSAHAGVSKSKVYLQPPSQWSMSRSSATVSVRLGELPEPWQMKIRPSD